MKKSRRKGEMESTSTSKSSKVKDIGSPIKIVQPKQGGNRCVNAALQNSTVATVTPSGPNYNRMSAMRVRLELIPPKQLGELITVVEVQGKSSMTSRQITIKENIFTKYCSRGFVSGSRMQGELVAINMEIDVAETGLKSTVSLEGRVTQPSASIDRSLIEFGECFINDRLDARVNLKNRTEDLAITYKIGNVAFFSAKPSEGKLQKDQSVEIIVTYRPTSLGEHNGIIPINICGEEVQFHVHCYGKTITPIHPGENLIPKKLLEEARRGVTVAAPQDFTKLHTNPNAHADEREKIEQLKATAKKILKKKFDETGEEEEDEKSESENEQDSNKLTSKSHSSQLRMDGATISVVDSSALDFLKETLTAENNKQKYVDYIRRSQAQRERIEKAALVPDLLDSLKKSRNISSKKEGGQTNKERLDAAKARRLGEFESDDIEVFRTGYDPLKDANIGLDDGGLGQVAPEPLVPRREEPLLIIKKSQKQVVVKAKTRPKLSEMNKLVKHKYKSSPTAALEQKEVKTAFTPEDVTLLSIGARTIDLGPTLVIANQELRGTSPESQVVPPGAMAQFDVQFVSDIALQFQGQILVQANGATVFSVSVRAEVIPISLDLNSQEVTLAFPYNNLG
ncbi:MAG: hypothetical protein EZS28_019697 [Streblomastix strix]|uniref:Uncharacterized protein n=1 Tax=Streblomastix strix TaxID=222440 RepID=A0A5J4VQ38_9EUKA|nr:MAG: hypothetical protein EZS28_019697 [Streblomastix strix]